MPTTRNRAGQIARELNVLGDELSRLNRTSIGEAQALLEAIFELHRLALRRLADAES
jgi:hypothetical protein